MCFIRALARLATDGRGQDPSSVQGVRPEYYFAARRAAAVVVIDEAGGDANPRPRRRQRRVDGEVA
jgi:hypothetical protein